MWSPRTLENKARYGSNEFQPDTKSFLYTNSANIIRAGFNQRRYQQGYPKYSFHNPIPKSRSREYIISRESQILGSNRTLENKENQRPTNIQVVKGSLETKEAKETYFGASGGANSPKIAGKEGGSQGRLILAPRPPKVGGIAAYSSNPQANNDFFRRQSSHADRRPSLRQITGIRDIPSREIDHELRLLERSRSRPAFLVNTQPEHQYSNNASNVSRSPPPAQEKAFYLIPGIPKAPLSSKGSTSPTNYMHKRENTNLTVVHRTPFAAKDSSVSLERSQLIRSGSVEHKGSVVMAPNSAVVVKTLADLDFDREIGKGSYAVVKLAYSKPLREKLAVKIYEKSKLSDPLKRKSVDREIAILQVMSHPFVIKYVAHFENKL